MHLTKFMLMGVLMMGLHIGASAQNSSAVSGTAVDGPSLPETMQFIRSKLGEWAHVRYTVSLQGNGADRAITYDALSMPDQCELSLLKHVKAYSGINNAGQVSDVSDVIYKLDLKDIASIRYVPFEAGASLEGVTLVWPPEIPSLNVGFNKEEAMKADGTAQMMVKDLDLVFATDQLADRFAKALNHAVTFCRGNPVVYQDLAARSEQERERLLAEFNERVTQLEQAQAQKKAQMDAQSAANLRATKSIGDVRDGNVGQDDSNTQSQISELQSDIEFQERAAGNDDSSAEQVLNNCSGGPGAAICQAIGQAGAAKLRQKAAQARNEADSDRQEIERLQGEEVQARQRRDTSYGSILQQVVTESGTGIQNAAAQQQANLQAMASTAQQRQQAQAQARLAASTSSNPVQAAGATPYPSSSSNNNAGSSSNTTSSGSATNSGYNPYSSTPAQGSYNPYTGTGTGSIQTRCADVTSTVTVHVSWHGPQGGFCQKELDVTFTDNNVAPVSCTWAYLKDGVWHNYGGGDIQPGQTVGGEWGGDWTCNPDSGEVRYMCFPKSEAATKDCSKQLPSDWK